MLPIAFLLPLLRAYWKPVAVSLAALAACGILAAGCHHYRKLVAENAVLEAQTKASSEALDRWKAAEAERTRIAAEAARVEEAARAETRRLNEAFTKNLTPEDLASRGDVARLFGMLGQATAINP